MTNIQMGVYFALIALGVILWVKSIILTRQDKGFGGIFMLNLVLFILYTFIWFKYSYNWLNKIGHDEYGLGVIFIYPLILVVHSFVMFSIAKARKMIRKQ
jgi:hypothetical protein